MTEFHIGQRLDRLPASRFHQKILWLIGLGMFFDTFEIYLTGGVLAAVVKAGFSNIHLNAAFISATFFGLTVGSFAAGILGDKFGRKFAYQFNLLLFGCASLASAVAPNMYVLIVLRGIMGIGLGAEIVVGFGTLVEFVPAKTRGRWQSALSLINNSSLAISSLIGFWVIPTFGWRYMFAIVGVGALVVWFLRRSMPESPRWYEAQGMPEKADEIMSAIEQEIERDLGITLPSPEIEASVAVQQSVDNSSLIELFAPRMLTRTMTACLVFIAMVTALYVYISWLPSILMHEGISLTKSLSYMAVISFGGPFGSAVGILVADRYSRKWTTIFFALTSAALGYVYAQQSSVDGLLVFGFLLVASMYVYNAVGFGAYVSELFPTRLRLRGCGIANTSARLVSIFTPYLVAYLLGNFGAASVYSIISIVFVITALCVMFMGVETRAKTLEAI